VDNVTRARDTGALECMVLAIGGVRLLAVECRVSTWTVRAWLSGERRPSPTNLRRLSELARELQVPTPFAFVGRDTRLWPRTLH
jgi:hypothetical protein